MLQACPCHAQHRQRMWEILVFSISKQKYFPFLLTPKLGLIPRINSMENLCNKKDLDDYQKYHCVEIASEVGPHVLPEACARLIASMSARLHHGAVGKACMQAAAWVLLFSLQFVGHLADSSEVVYIIEANTGMQDIQP